ncbi:MAG: FmdB family transcriptional regulator [Chloroflexi bacterium]|nr:MAG: FmdB family transcriptional regulator [Chloroflexota bacterium]
MPTYTYRCTNCGHKFEARQRMTDEPLTECPQCEGKIRRVVNSVGVVFKGKGFYVTDNRGSKAQAPSSTSNKKDESNHDKSSASSSSNSQSSSSDTKSTKSEESKSAA